MKNQNPPDSMTQMFRRIATKTDALLNGAVPDAIKQRNVGQWPVRYVASAAGAIRTLDTGGRRGLPVTVITPDGPNSLEHCVGLIANLAQHARVIALDLPGFGFSYPSATYGHTMDEGADAVFDVLDAYDVERATFVFTCANGFYAMRAAQSDPERVRGLVLSQTPSIAAMNEWAKRNIPWPLRVPVLGQSFMRVFRKQVANQWYKTALPRGVDRSPYESLAHESFGHGGCFCLAGVVQGLAEMPVEAVRGISCPITAAWGAKDFSHKYTAPDSILHDHPHAVLQQFESCGHFPDLEATDKFSTLVKLHLSMHG